MSVGEKANQLYFPKHHINIVKKIEGFYIYYGKEIIACILDQDLQCEDTKYTVYANSTNNTILPEMTLQHIQEAIRKFNPGGRQQKEREELLNNFLERFPLFAPEYKDKINIEDYKKELQTYSETIDNTLRKIESAYEQNIFYSGVDAGNNGRIKDLHQKISQRKRIIEQSQNPLTEQDREKITLAHVICETDARIYELERNIRKIEKFATEKDTLLNTIKKQFYKINDFDNLSERSKRKLGNIDKNELTQKIVLMTEKKEKNMIELLDCKTKMQELMKQREKIIQEFLLLLPDEIQYEQKLAQGIQQELYSIDFAIEEHKKSLALVYTKGKTLRNIIQRSQQDLKTKNNIINGIVRDLSAKKDAIRDGKRIQGEEILTLENKLTEYRKEYNKSHLQQELDKQKNEYNEILEEANQLKEIIGEKQQKIATITIDIKKVINTIMKEVHYYHSVSDSRISEEDQKTLQADNTKDQELYRSLLEEEKNIEARLKQYEGEIAFFCNGIKKEGNEINYTESGISALWDDKILPCGIELYTAREYNQKRQTQQEKFDYKGQDFKIYKEQVKKLLWDDYMSLIMQLRNWIDTQKPNFKHKEIEEFNNLGELFLWTDQDEKQLEKMKHTCEIKIGSEMRVQYGIGDEIGRQEGDKLKVQYKQIQDEIMQLEQEKEFLRILNEKYRHHLHTQKKNKTQHTLSLDINTTKPGIGNTVPPHSTN